MRPVIGVDFDNTLVYYDSVIRAVAEEEGWLEAGAAAARGAGEGAARGEGEGEGAGPGASKKDVRDRIRELPDGEMKWRRLQAAVYGPRIGEATMAEGAERFLASCRDARAPVYVISHKTRRAAADETGTDLREAALGWMSESGLFDPAGPALTPGSVFFEPTRGRKVSRIAACGCTHFIDDLEETFAETSFPAGVKKILYRPAGELPQMEGVTVCRSWGEVHRLVFGQR
jgi:hypothetical protein